MSIDKKKKGNRYLYRARFRYTGPDGKKHQTGTAWYATKKEAEAAGREMEEQLSRAESSSTVTFRAVWEEWLDDCTRTGKNVENIVNERRSVLERRFDSWSDLPVGQITAQMVRCRLAEEDIEQLAVNTKNKYRTILHMVFDFAIKFYQLGENPVDKISSYAETEFKEDDKVIYTPEQFNLMVAQMNPVEDFRALFTLIYWLGLRRSEALSLTFGDYDGSTIRIHRSWDPARKKWRPLKTKASNRTVRLPNFLIELIDGQIRKYEGYEGFCRDWFIFGGYRPLCRTTMDRRRKQAILDAGLPEVATNHELRHSYVSNMMALQENAWLVARSAGHAKTDTTLTTYAHLQVSDLTEQQTALYDSACHTRVTSVSQNAENNLL